LGFWLRRGVSRWIWTHLLAPNDKPIGAQTWRVAGYEYSGCGFTFGVMQNAHLGWWHNLACKYLVRIHFAVVGNIKNISRSKLVQKHKGELIFTIIKDV
jgi:hypothetical protein